MNDHPYLDSKGKQIIGGKKTGFVFSDAVRQINCPKCKSNAAFNCQTHAGKLAWPPHNARIKLAASLGLL